jgi:hypothetical protein
MSDQWPATPLFGLLVTVTGIVGFGGDDALETVEAQVAAPVFQPAFAEGPDPFFPIELQLAGSKRRETGIVGCSDQGYVGLSEQQAISRAVSIGCAWRVASIDGIPAPGTTDFRQDRVNFELVGGLITRACIG